MKNLLFIFTIVITTLLSSCTKMVNVNGEIVAEMPNISESANVDSIILNKALVDTAGYNKNIIFSKDGKEVYVYIMHENQPNLEYTIKSEVQREEESWGLFIMVVIIVLIFINL